MDRRVVEAIQAVCVALSGQENRLPGPLVSQGDACPDGAALTLGFDCRTPVGVKNPAHHDAWCGDRESYGFVECLRDHARKSL